MMNDIDEEFEFLDMEDIQKQFDIDALTSQGFMTKKTEIRKLEAKLKKEPDDVNSRLVLVGHYRHARFLDPRASKRFVEHTSWFVANHPQHPVLADPPQVFRGTDGREAYVAIKKLWVLQTEALPNDLAVLEHAATFFQFDECYLSERLLLHAESLEPMNSKWSLELSLLYELWGCGHEWQAIGARERAIEKARGTSKCYAYERLPALLLQAGEIQKAEKAAHELLSLARRYDPDLLLCASAIQAAHTTLGRIALMNDDIEKANQHLLSSVAEISSRQRSGSTAERSLAELLLGVGQQEIVWQYWTKCADIWGDHMLECGKRMMEEGAKTSDFADDSRFFDLTGSVRPAFNSGDLTAARAMAQEMLVLAENFKDNERHYGYALHLGQTVLGQLALRDGDIVAAKEYLNLAADVAEAERLYEDGPDLTLAAELVKQGEIIAVRRFLRKVKKFWNERDGKLRINDWIAAVERGEVDYDLLWS